MERILYFHNGCEVGLAAIGYSGIRAFMAGHFTMIRRRVIFPNCEACTWDTATPCPKECLEYQKKKKLSAAHDGRDARRKHLDATARSLGL